MNLKHSLSLPNFYLGPAPITPAIMSIGKPKDRQKGDPDYVIKAERWDIWVYGDWMSERSDPWDTRNHELIQDKHQKAFLDLVGSNGNETMAMLYKEYVGSPDPHTNLHNFIDLTTEYRIKYLVYFMLYEPHKIKWVDYIEIKRGAGKK